jgi:phosphoribosylformylglycinamidine synthase subunit PurL
VTGGNVSLYNENPRGAIHPTPTIGMVGVVEDLDHVTTSGFAAAGDAIVLLGRNTDELGGSEYLKVVHGRVAGDAPSVDLAEARAAEDAAGGDPRRHRPLRARHGRGRAGGGAGGERVRRRRAAGAGVDVSLDDDLPAAALLFGEAQGRALVSCAAGDVDRVLGIARAHGVPARRIGTGGRAGGRLPHRDARRDDRGCGGGADGDLRERHPAADGRHARRTSRRRWSRRSRGRRRNRATLRAVRK